MKTQYKLFKPVYLVVLYTLVSLAFAIALLTLDMPMSLMTLMMVPIIWAVIYYSINLCVLMLAIFGLVTVGFTYLSGEPFGSSLIAVLVSMTAFAIVLFLIDGAIMKRNQLEDELRQTHERLKTALDNTLDGIWDWNIKKEEIFLSQNAQAYLGQTKSIIPIYKVDIHNTFNFLEIFPAIHPQDVEGIQNKLDACINGQIDHYEIEYRVADKDGEYRWVLGRGRVILDPESGGLHRITGSVMDIHNQKVAEMTLAISEARYRHLVETQGEGVGIVDNTEKFLFANPAAEAIFGVPMGTLHGRNLHEFLDEGEFKRIQEETEKRIKGMESSYELWVIRPDGERRRVHVTATTSRNSRGDYVGAVGVFRDVTEDQESEERLLFENTHDALTGLFNRKFYETEIDRLEIEQVAPVSFIMLDVDKFKQVNDQLGHQIGDELLRDFANVLRLSVREPDRVTRIGGDEFAIILPGVGPEVMQKVMARIQKNMELENAIPDKRYFIAFSMGGETNFTGNNLRSTISKADASMYREKRLKHITN